MEAVAAIKRRFELLGPVLNERTRRLVAAAEAVAYGRGGGMAVARATASRISVPGVVTTSAPK